MAGGLLYFPRCLGFLASLGFLGFLGFLSFLGFLGFWDSGAGEGRGVAEAGVSGEGAVAGGAVRDLGSMASRRVLGPSGFWLWRAVEVKVRAVLNGVVRGLEARREVVKGEGMDDHGRIREAMGDPLREFCGTVGLLVEREAYGVSSARMISGTLAFG